MDAARRKTHFPHTTLKAVSPSVFPNTVWLCCVVPLRARPGRSLIKEPLADLCLVTGRTPPLEIVAAVECVKQGWSNLFHWRGRSLSSSWAHPRPTQLRDMSTQLCSTVSE